MAISICISTRDRSEFIPWVKSQIESQTIYSKIDNIVVVDGSTDNTIAKQWENAFPNATVIWKPNILLGNSRNTAIAAATANPNSKYIALWDDDDFYLPTHLEESVSILEKKPHIDVVGSSKTIMYFTNSTQFVELGPYGPTHALEPSLVFRLSYATLHTFPTDGDECRLGQGKKFLQDWCASIITKEPSYLHIAHGANLYNKEKIFEEPCKNKANILDVHPAKLYRDWIRNSEQQTLFEKLF